MCSEQPYSWSRSCCTAGDSSTRWYTSAITSSLLTCSLGAYASVSCTRKAEKTRSIDAQLDIAIQFQPSK